MTPDFLPHQKDLFPVLKNYFDGLYHADSQLLSKVFHPDARYVNMTNNDYMNLSIPEYLHIIDQRTPPATNQEPRNDQILAIDFSNNSLAFVKGKMTMMGREYLDLLTCTFDKNEWRIMSKIFTYQTIQEEK
ncbi:nuclear transport factor 2 family protein [Curvivirga sp.]|uniref:nuclear transport factor 2 family protein n=1 Tax=Curvivirga sp. TaxID=2856848 RepID=UPI003B5C525A